jgi:hypothetical protein
MDRVMFVATAGTSRNEHDCLVALKNKQCFHIHVKKCKNGKVIVYPVDLNIGKIYGFGSSIQSAIENLVEIM